MNTEYKYTTDGKKVIIVGNLNSQEKIVQEIFIVNGNEIPSGENFVAKSLHDFPAVSWKESELTKLESRYDKERQEWDSKISKLNEERQLAYSSLSARVKWLRGVAKEPRTEEFRKVINQIADFISDAEKWVFVRDYSQWHLERFNEDGCNQLIDRYENSYSRKRFDSMRLLSLYGSSDGSLVFRINDYGDGSGSDKDLMFFKSKKEALLFMQTEFDKLQKYSESDLKNAEKFNLKLDDEKLKTWSESITKGLDKTIEEYKKLMETAIEKKNKIINKA